MSRVVSALGFASLWFFVDPSPRAVAGDWYVDAGFAGCATGDGSAGNPFCAIGDAVAAAVDGDTIHVAPGTYAERVVVDKDLTILGTSGREVTIVDGSKSGRPLTVQANKTVVVDGMTFTNGLALPGAGVFVGQFASFTLTKSAVVRNGDNADEANGGGGIAISGSAIVELRDSLVEENLGVYEGGGIRIDALASVTITRCGVNANWSGFDDFGGVGGGIFNDGATLVIERSSICRNAANRFGSSSSGGGIHSAGGTLTLVDSVVCDNSAFSFYSPATGGGLHVATAGALIQDTTIAGNTVDSGMSAGSGGGLHASGSLTLERSTVAGNTADHGGGVLVGGAATFGASHAILARNTSVAATSPDCDGTLTSSGYNLVGDTTGCIVVGDPTGNQLDVDPQFLDATNGDFRLASGSPAIEAGDPTLLPDGVDAGGQPRVLDADFDRVMWIDLGAHEFSHVLLTVTGDPSPGGTVTLDSSGTAGLALFLFVGTAPADVLFRPFGRVFLDFASPWLLVPFGTIPSSVAIDVPASIPSGTFVIVQDLAFDAPTRGGNLSNAVELTIE